jgi:hypothetical protein
VIAEGWPDRAGTFSLLRDRAVHDHDWPVRAMALRTVAGGWPEHDDSLSLVQGRLVDDLEWFVRDTAVEVLAKSWGPMSAPFAFCRNAQRPIPTNWCGSPPWRQSALPDWMMLVPGRGFGSVRSPMSMRRCGWPPSR